MYASQANLAQNNKNVANDTRYPAAPIPSGGCYPKDPAPFRNMVNTQYQQQRHSGGNDYANPLFKALQQPPAPQPLQAIQQHSMQYNQQQQGPPNSYYANNRMQQNTLQHNNYGNGNNPSMLSTMTHGPLMGQHSNEFGIQFDKENIHPLPNGYGIQGLMGTNSNSNKFSSAFPQDQQSNVFQSLKMPATKGLTDPLAMHNPRVQCQDNWKKKGEHLTDLSLSRKSMMDVVSAYWEPPKPDTPTEMVTIFSSAYVISLLANCCCLIPKNLPFWLDPVWSDSLQNLDNISMRSDASKMVCNNDV